jgi:hypothetical protein
MSGGLDFGAIARAKAEHRAALALAFTGVGAGPPEPEPDPTPRVPGFDGGARQPAPLPPETHEQWLSAVLRGEVARDNSG